MAECAELVFKLCCLGQLLWPEYIAHLKHDFEPLLCELVSKTIRFLREGLQVGFLHRHWPQQPVGDRFAVCLELTAQ